MITRANFRSMVWAVVLAALFVAACGSSDGIAGAGADDQPSGDLGFADDDESRPDADPNVSAGEPGFGSSPPTTAGSGLPPVTTIPALPGGTMDGYTGVLGRLRVDEVVAEPIAPPPGRRDGFMPLTGLPGEVPQRPAAVVKIDNGSAAVPQTGLNSADIVIEEEVEGGVTRFAAIFHSTPSIVGPVRSGRTTDVGLISGLGSPLLLYSGANDLTETILRRQPHIQNHSHSTSSGYWRDDSRNAPSNLYTDTAPHWASAVGSAPPPQFEYRTDDDSVGGSAVESFSIDYPASAASWKWQDGQWERHQREPVMILSAVDRSRPQTLWLSRHNGSEQACSIRPAGRCRSLCLSEPARPPCSPMAVVSTESGPGRPWSTPPLSPTGTVA